MSIILIIGSVQAFFIEILLLNKKSKQLSDWVLAVWVFILGVHLFLFYLFFIEYYLTFPHFMSVLRLLPLLHGPLLFLYVSSLIKPNPKIGKLEILHFLPLVIAGILMINTFLMTKDELLEFAFVTIEVEPPLYWQFLSFLNEASGLVYVLASVAVLLRFRKRIKDNFSDVDKVNLSWLLKLIVGMAAIWLAVLISNEEQYIFLIATFFVFVIGYFGVRQAAIFTNDKSFVTERTEARENNNEKAKYENSSLTPVRSQEYLDRLSQYMGDEKPYLEAKITLKDISDRLDIHPNHLSQVINEKLEMNFYDFINGHRVEEFKNRLLNDRDKRFTLLAHAFDSGFSSKSSFNEVFKKVAGLTPSQFQKSLHK